MTEHLTKLEAKETDLVPFEQSLEIAKKLMEKYWNEIYPRLAYKREHGGGFGRPGRDEHKQIDDFLEQLKDQPLGKFRGHGVKKGPHKEWLLASFINAIQNNTMKGDSGELRGGYINAYTDADFLIISHYNQSLHEVDQEKLRLTGWPVPKRNKLGTVINPGAFVVNDAFYPLAEDLKRMFPKANIIRADELPQYIKGEVKNKEWERKLTSIESNAILKARSKC